MLCNLYKLNCSSSIPANFDWPPFKAAMLAMLEHAMTEINSSLMPKPSLHCASNY
jgi:hypothetical protein